MSQKQSASQAASGIAPSVRKVVKRPPVIRKHLPHVSKPKPWWGAKLPPWGNSTTQRAVGGHGKESNDYIPSYQEIGTTVPNYTDSSSRQYFWCIKETFPLLYKQMKQEGTITSDDGVLVVKLPESKTRADHKQYKEAFDFPVINDGKIELLANSTTSRWFSVLSTSFPSHRAVGYLVVKSLQ